MQAHYAARAHGRPAGYTAPYPYCDLVRPLLGELAASAASAAAAEVAGRAGAACSAAGGGQATAGTEDYALFDCI